MLARLARAALSDGLAVLLLAAATLVALDGVLDCGFVSYDDGEYITDNPHVREGLTDETFTWAWTTTRAANWHPLTWLSLMLDSELFGHRPRGFHRTNLLLHLANVLLLYALLRRLTGAVWRSFFVAALFAAHPLHVQSVAWVTERKDVLSTFFGLLALLAYERYARRPGVVRYVPVVLGMVLSLMAKPMLVTLPFVLLLFDYWPLQRWRVGQAGCEEPGLPPARSLTALLLEKVPLFLLSAASAYVTMRAQSGAVISLEHHPLSFRLANTLVSYAQYLRQTFWPRDLAILYPFPQGGIPPWQVAVAALLLAAITTAALALGRRHPYLAVGWLFYLGTLVPVIGLIQVGHQARADRYTYVPLLGVFLMLTWTAAAACSSAGRRRLLGCLAGLVLVLLVLQCRAETEHWHNTFALWNHAVEISPSKMAYCNRGWWYFAQGDWQTATEDFEAALRLNPGDADGLIGLGAVAGMQGKTAQAEQLFREAIAHRPDNADGHAQLGQCLLRQGRRREAAQHLQEALRLRPDSPIFRFNYQLALPRSAESASQ